MTDTDRYRAPALEKGLEIIELLANVEGGLTQAEIAKNLQRKPNELYRMLDTLVRRGYVNRDDNGLFELTLKMFSLSNFHAPTRRLASFATPIMRDLATKTKQANQLVVFDRGNCVIIAQQEAPGYWGISIRVGSHLNLFNTGSGKTLLAFNDPERRNAMVFEHTGGRRKSLSADLQKNLKDIKTRGHELMPSAQTSGVYNISAPVLIPDGNAIAALTIPYIGLINHKKSVEEDMQECAEQLKVATKSIAKRIGVDT